MSKDPLRIFVNAASIREGGPRVVLLKLLAGMLDIDSDLRITVAAPPATCEELGAIAIERHPVVVGQSPPALLKWYEFGLADAAARRGADVIFSLTNYLPLRRLALPTVLLEQHAGHFSPIFDELMRAPTVPLRERLSWRPRRAWVRRSVETATVLMVQTAALADAVAASTPRVPRNAIRVIPHGPGWVEPLVEPKHKDAGNPIRIGYVAKSGVQKNFTTLFCAVRILASEGRDVRLTLTLDTQEPSTRTLLAEAEALGIGNRIDNRGEVDVHSIAGLYDELDIFVFPSLCESFGVPMVEAMARGLCMVVADTPENREVAGSAGIVFPALDADRLALLLGELCADPPQRYGYALKSLSRARDFSWQKAAAETLAALRDAAAHVC